MSEVCTDNRFEIIAAYKKKLIESTNIETNPDEMAVIDNVLFRFWQMGWLPPVPHGALMDRDDFFAACPELVDGYKRITDDLVVIPAEEKEENFCANCHWYESEQQYCFRNGCHAYNESTCELWEPMPADEPIPAPCGKTVPTTYDLLYEEGGYNSNGV
jgi:hypothetical protein